MKNIEKNYQENNMKILIGTLVAWYETELLPLYLESLQQAIDYASKLDVAKDLEVHFDFYVTNPDNGLEIEILDSSMLRRNNGNRTWRCIETLKLFEGIINNDLKFGESKLKVTFDIRQDPKANYETENIAYYRRELINKGKIEEYDFTVWGETDALFPKTLFRDIAMLFEYSKVKPIVACYSGCRMWDNSWKLTEHKDFTDKPFIENDTENWWSLKYNMSLQEMNEINEKYEDNPTAIVAREKDIKFNGCGLIISKLLLQTGVNIPNEIWFVHEDSALLYEIQNKVKDAEQIIFKDLLLVHNRKHPLKRTGIQGEEHINAPDVGAKRKTQPWYMYANHYCELNLGILYKSYAQVRQKLYSWEDVWKDVGKSVTAEFFTFDYSGNKINKK